MLIDDLLTARELGVVAEDYVASICSRKKLNVVRPKNRQLPFDLFVNGKRVEIKCARPSASNLNKWGINIHRHGKLKEYRVDVYAILLDFRHLGKVKPLVLFRKAPIGATTILYSVESLLKIHNKDIENWSVFDRVRGEL